MNVCLSPARVRSGRSLAAIALALALAAGCRRPALRVEPLALVCNGYRLAGDLYVPARRTSDQAILLLHGSAELARRLRLYPELSERLARRGYIVCNLDQRGHGDSQGPDVVRSVEDLAFVADARAAAQGLLAQTRGRGIRGVVLAGHSFGGGVAVAAGLTCPEVTRVISISPGRRIEERLSGDNADRERQRIQKRKTADMGLASPIPLELIEPMLATYDVGRFRGARVTKPLLFIEGGREDAGDLAFTRELAASMTGPVEVDLVPGADHYFGTRPFERDGVKGWTVADTNALEALAGRMDGWLRGP